MIFGTAKLVVSLFVTMIAMYVFFFVPVGSRTLYEYSRRIAGTSEAQEFGHEMRGAGTRVITKAQHEIRVGFPLPAARDGGVFEGFSIPVAPALPTPRVHAPR
ncbi:MAG: hypothetical protein WCJ30_14840 [Deltaproteobacteria bacterium]